LAQPFNCFARPLNTWTTSIDRAECGPTKHRKNTRDPFAIRVRVRAAYELSYSYNKLGDKIGLKVTFNILKNSNNFTKDDELAI